MRTLQLYATGSATANAVAQLTIPVRATLRLLQVAFSIDSITDNAVTYVELSRASASQIGINGALDPIFRINMASNFVTSGLVHSGICQAFPLDAPFEQGAILYLHATVGGTATYTFNGILWY